MWWWVKSLFNDFRGFWPDVNIVDKLQFLIFIQYKCDKFEFTFVSQDTAGNCSDKTIMEVV